MLHHVLSLLLVPILSLNLLSGLFSSMLRIDGTAMVPTLEDRDIVHYEKIGAEDMRRFDLVICRYPGRGDTLFVKRLIGLPGDVVEIRDNVLYVNGVGYSESYVDQQPPLPAVEVPDGCYFVAGDNRMNSHDSRHSDVGPLTADLIVGRVTDVRGKDDWTPATPAPISSSEPAAEPDDALPVLSDSGISDDAGLSPSDWPWADLPWVSIITDDSYALAGTAAGAPAIPADLAAILCREAAANRLHPAFLAAVIAAESGFDPQAVSRAGNQGLMQLTPHTARELADTINQFSSQPIVLEESSLLDPNVNVRLGAYLISDLSYRYNGNPVLIATAYHIGDRMTDHILTSGGTAVPTDGTIPYVRRVLQYYEAYLPLFQSVSDGH